MISRFSFTLFLLGAHALWLSATAFASGIPSIRCAVQTIDGKKFVGKTDLQQLSLTTPYAEIQTPLDQVASLEWLQDRESTRIVLTNGDRLSGILHTESLPLVTESGPEIIPIKHARKISFSSTKPNRQGLVIHYKFNRPANELAPSAVIDSSGMMNHGRLNGPKWILRGTKDGAYRFNGESDSIDCSKDSLLQEPPNPNIFFRATLTM